MPKNIYTLNWKNVILDNEIRMNVNTLEASGNYTYHLL